MGYFYLYPKMQEGKQISEIKKNDKERVEASKQTGNENSLKANDNKILTVNEVHEGDVFIMSDGTKIRLLGGAYEDN
ncbi:MAG: hypothetical protein ABI840_01460 [bacterium]